MSRSPEPFAFCYSEGAKRPKNLAQGKLRERDETISLQISSPLMGEDKGEGGLHGRYPGPDSIRVATPNM